MATREAVEQAVNGHGRPEAVQAMIARKEQRLRAKELDHAAIMEHYSDALIATRAYMPPPSEDLDFLRDTMGPKDDSMSITHRVTVRVREVK